MWSRVGIAAMLLMAVGIGSIAYRSLRTGTAPVQVAAPAMRTITTEPGERLAVRLSDGTLATLAPGSTMRIPAAYGERERAVELAGEAAFTVTHDASRPFVVLTEHLIARDLGTRFVVRAYGGEQLTDVVVAEGKVAVARPSVSHDSVLLQRGERARVTSGGQVTHVRGVSLDPYFAWTEGRLVFDRTPLRDVAVQLSRWHAIDIRLVNPELGALELTATFRDEPVAEVLQIIAAILNLDVIHTDRAVYTLHAPR